MKHIKLFEAFKSFKLSKTLKFIDDDSRKTFLNKLKNLCKSFDFPVSELNDDFFTYLPYKKAFNFHKDPEKKPCTQTSSNQFSRRVALPDEKCNGGKIKRSWGVGKVRVVECERCKGTGLEPFSVKWKYLKFWFNSDGKYVCMTATDGHVQDEDTIFKYDTIVDIPYGDISRNFWNYDIDRIKTWTKDANFALILDLDTIFDMYSTDIERTNTTKSNRNSNNQNALALQPDSDIKLLNISRYFNEIINRSQIKGNLNDIKNIKRVIMRILCGNKILFAMNHVQV